MAETSGSSASGRSMPVPLTSSSEGGTRGAAAPGAGSSGSGSSSRDGRGAPLPRSRGRPVSFPYPPLARRALEGPLPGTGGGVHAAAPSNGAGASSAFAQGQQMPAITWRQPIPVSPEQALRQEIASLQHRLQTEHATVHHLQAQMHASQHLTGSGKVSLLNGSKGRTCKRSA